MYDSYLGGKLALNVLYLAPEHEGLQDLMQSVNDNHSLLHGYIILPSRPGGSLAEAVTKPLGKLVLVIKHLSRAGRVQSDWQAYVPGTQHCNIQGAELGGMLYNFCAPHTVLRGVQYTSGKV